MIDETHDPAAGSWVEGANAHPDFPVQNLPLGIFSTESATLRPGTAIGDFVLDLRAAATLLRNELPAAVVAALHQTKLNLLFELAPDARLSLRRALFFLLTDRSREAAVRAMLYPAAHCRLHMPLVVRDFTDFFAGIHHARAAGSLFRPDHPLLPNYKYVPVGYHSRASSIRVSGGEVVRPQGQTRAATTDTPLFGPSARLDYEVELGIWVSGRSELGHSVPIEHVNEHIAGFCLLNDWSARDIQAWEYQPLGPFLAKNFATTVSPWIVTAEALAPFRRPQAARPDGDPAPLPYLLGGQDQLSGAFNICIDASLLSQKMREQGCSPLRLGRTTALHLYWTPGQLVAHHTVNGCDLAAGDLLGSGTISGPDDESRGSLLELTRGGRDPIFLTSGEARLFLEDGDTVILTGWADADDFRRIGMGTCEATIIGRTADTLGSSQHTPGGLQQQLEPARTWGSSAD